MLRYFVLSCSIMLIGQLNAQTVWPGDVNNNGLVNHIDMLYFAQAFGATGPPRINQGIDWEGKDIPVLWTEDFPNGVNYAFADCNGDGVVDEFDREAFMFNENFNNPSLTHGTVVSDDFGVGVLGQSPTLAFGAPTDPSFEGVPAMLPLFFGTEGLPVENFYGLAFTLSFENNIVDNGFFPFINLGNFEEDWFGMSGNEPIVEFFPDFSNNKIHVVASRSDQQSAPTNFGEFGSFFIVIIDNVVGWGNDQIQTEFIIEDINLMDEVGASSAVFGDTLNMTIYNDDIVNDEEENIENFIEVFPNPVKDYLSIEAKNASVLSFQLIDIAGRVVEKSFDLNDQNIQLNTQSFPSGIYQIEIETTKGRLTKKVVIQQ